MSFVRCASKPYSIYANAESLADSMHRIAHWAKTHPNSQKHTLGIIKLPPVFATDENGRSNLVAIIKTLAEYEDGCVDGSSLTLQELPDRYNHNGGMPKLASSDLRKVHNWLQQVSFAIRAAAIDHALDNGMNDADEIASIVLSNLYSNEKRAFVTFSPDNKYELKPLRHANADAKKGWIAQEVKQRLASDTSEYGAKPNYVEWKVYGHKGHNRVVDAAFAEELTALIKQANVLDGDGKYEEADMIDIKLNQCMNNLDILARVGQK